MTTSRKTRKHTGGNPVEYESFLSYVHRIFLFWYSQINPDKANAFLQSKGSKLQYIPSTPDQATLTPEQREVLLALVNFIFVDDEDGHEEEFANAFLDISADAFNKAMVQKEAVGTSIFDPYKKKNVIAESFAKSMARLPNLLRKSPQNLLYYSDWSEGTCGLSPDMLTNPFETLQSNYCIPVFTDTPTAKKSIVNSFSMMTNSSSKDLPSNYPYIILKNEFLPMLTHIRADNAFLKAPKFATTSWIKNAFQKNGVVDIHPTLASLLKKEAFDLWNSSLWCTLYKITGIEDILFETEKYIITDNSIFPTKEIYTHLQYFKERKTNNVKFNLLLNLIRQKKIYGMDSISSLFIRLLLPKEWIFLTNDPNVDKFVRISFGEQLLLCKLQHIAYLKMAFKGICGSSQNNIIRNNSSDTPLRKASLLNGMKVYSMDLSKADVQETLLQYIEDTDAKKIYKSILEKL